VSDPLARAYDVGRAAWPALVVAEPAFRGFVTARLPDAEVTDAALAALVVADLYLACACVERVDGATAAFEAHCMQAVDAAVARIDSARPIIDEVRQVVMDLLFVGKHGRGAIDTYSGRGSLRGWVRVIGVREAVRIVRQSSNKVMVEDEAMFDALAPTERDDPELEYLKHHYRTEFKRAFVDAIAALPRRERTALRMNVIDGSSIDDIGAAFRVHRATAARWLGRARESLIESTKRGLMRELRLTHTEVESVIRLVRSNLDVTLDSVLNSRK